MIRKILLIIFSKFAKNNVNKIAKAQKWIDNAQATFANAIQEAAIAEARFDELAEETLADIEKIKEDAMAKVADLDKVLLETQERREQAAKFKNKIESFLE